LEDTRTLGQFIPLHYHFEMLSDNARMSAFKSAINRVVKPGDVVLELGSGTGVLSFFAAEKARKVYAVELNLDLVDESRRFLQQNRNGEKVEVIHADAFEYIPPEPVDVVICEMLHVGLLREKQLEVIDAFKRRYQRNFEGSLPIFIPEAVIQAVMPVQYDFDFDGYYAPIMLFQNPYSNAHSRTMILGDPVIYHQLQYAVPYMLSCQWSSSLQITEEGTLNALRIITKNILVYTSEINSTITWDNQFLIVPLDRELQVHPEQRIAVSLDYHAGAPLSALRPVVSETVS